MAKSFSVNFFASNSPTVIETEMKLIENSSLEIEDLNNSTLSNEIVVNDILTGVLLSTQHSYS